MKKLITLIVVCILCMATFFAGCQSTGYSNKLGGFDGEVSSNGGSVVVKGDYAYFINGVAEYTDSNEYGSVSTGSLVRIKKSDLAAPDGKAEIVIPSLFVAGDKTAGFWIFGNEVFYATPTTAKNQAGVIENSKLDFVKTSLSGDKSVILTTVDSNSTSYRYVQSGSTVYLVMQTVNDDDESIIEVFDASAGKSVAKTDAITAAIFCEDNSALTVYYTAAVHNEELDQDEDYNEIRAVVIGGSNVKTDEVVLSGKGSIADKDSKFGISGATFTLITDTKDVLFFKAALLDKTTTESVKYYALKKADGSIVSLADGITSTLAETVFASTSFFIDEHTIVYLDSTHGILKYDYENKDEEGSSNRSVLYVDDDVLSYTARFISGDYLYLTDSSSYYYRINLTKLLAGKKGVELQTVSVLSSSTEWYLPEIVDDKYMLSIYTSDPYYSLVFVSDVTKEYTDEEIDAIHEASCDAIIGNYKFCASVRDSALTEKLTTYLDENYPVED